MVVLTSFTEPTEGIRHRQQNTVVYVNDNNLGKGTLYIAESRLSWIGETGNGFSIEYPHISLHAISRDLSAFPQECLFLMLDTSLGEGDQNNGEEEDDDGHDSSRQETTELRLVPDDRGMLDAMFHAMNACQALHPDPEDSFSDEDFFEDADEEVPMEETDSQMAQLRIGNMAGRAHMVGRSECILGDRVVGRGADRGADTLEGRVVDRGAGTLEGMVGDTVADREADTLEGREGDMGYNRASGILGAGRVGGNMASGIWGAGRVGGNMASGILGVGRVGGSMALGTVGGNTVSDTLGDMEEAGTEAGLEGGMEVGTAARIPRGGRSFFSGSMSHPDRSAGSPSAHSLQMALDSNFDDAEN